METSQTKPTHLSKRRRHGFWLSRVILLLGLPLLLYYGYCWGWWGRNSLLLQYIFQCGCPTSSNESRYPDKVDVVVPACFQNAVILSPSGRLLYVNRNMLWNDVSYFLNLQTGEKNSYTIPNGSSYFLTDDLMFLQLRYSKSHEGGEYILDRTTEKLYPLSKFEYWRSDAYVNGKVNINVLIEGLQKARAVFLTGYDDIVAIAPDFHDFPEHNFIADSFDIPGETPDREEKFLQNHDIPYIRASSYSYSQEALSPDGRFIAHR